MSKNIRTLYLYIVSFITLCMLVGAFVAIVNTTVSYLAPTVNYYRAYPSYPYESVNDSNYENTDPNAVEDYRKGLEEERLVQKTRNLKSIFSSIAVLLVSAPLFIYHWGKIEKERKEEGAM